ncbi:unnamed protein product [Rotaria sordida]|uniref:Uncharacterized protein n=1 Tax=Rotaria sordida TaxID=392033 RepID=A0A814MBR5_9BILA|nr:unnamed protein product [Rotaria sordida]
MKFSCDLGRNEFDMSGRHKLNCKGRPCVTCHKCLDWYFTGHQTTFDWIRRYKQWTDEDRSRYYSDKIYNLFKKRDGATCDDFGPAPAPEVIHRDGHDFHRESSYVIGATGSAMHKYRYRPNDDSRPICSGYNIDQYHERFHDICLCKDSVKN